MSKVVFSIMALTLIAVSGIGLIHVQSHDTVEPATVDRRESVNKTHYDNGNLKREYYKNERGWIVWEKRYDEHGQLKDHREWNEKKSKSEKIYYANGQLKTAKTWSETGLLESEHYYFTNGNLKREHVYDENTRMQHSAHYRENGQLKNERVTAYFKDSDPWGPDYFDKSSKFYYENGLLQREIINDKDGNLISDSRYHENGQLSHELINDEDGKIMSDNRYHENGQLYHELHYDQRGKLEHGKLYSYNGQLIREKEWHENGELFSKKFYHENGELKDETYYNNNGKLKSYRYYHENGELKDETYYNNNGKLKSYRYYHENGQLASKAFHNEGGQLKSHKFYDEHGQLKLERELYVNGTLKSVNSHYEYATNKMNGQTPELRNAEDMPHLTLEKIPNPAGYWVPIVDVDNFAELLVDVVGDKILYKTDNDFFTERGGISMEPEFTYGLWSSVTYTIVFPLVGEQDKYAFMSKFMDGMGFRVGDGHLVSQEIFDKCYMDHGNLGCEFDDGSYFVKHRTDDRIMFWMGHEFSDIRFTFYNNGSIQIEFDGWTNDPGLAVFQIEREDAIRSARDFALGNEELNLSSSDGGRCEVEVQDYSDGIQTEKIVVSGVPFYLVKNIAECTYTSDGESRWYAPLTSASHRDAPLILVDAWTGEHGILSYVTGLD